MFTRWLPWKFLVQRTARAYGIIDPLTFLARLRRFSQPSEVQEPIELLRAGIAFHARGLINTKAIQYNLDWVWPFWVERQFNPADVSFLPRSFSFSHVNLTHRNWTAVGHPSLDRYPVVDPRGLVTPLFDGWSLDGWLIPRQGKGLVPSKLERADQSWDLSGPPAVATRCESEHGSLAMRATVDLVDGRAVLSCDYEAAPTADGWLVLAVRPYNPEGVQFVESITYGTDPPRLSVDGTAVFLEPAPEAVRFSDYRRGDVIHRLRIPEPVQGGGVACDVGMATASALFPVASGGTFTARATVPLTEAPHGKGGAGPVHEIFESWESCLAPAAALEIPDSKIGFLYDAAVRSLLLLSAGDFVPGPFTYRRFWFRDACLMLNALMAAGLTDRARRIIDTFPEKQKATGYFRSQAGEWDSNGQVLWIMGRYHDLTGDPTPKAWLKAIRKGAAWIRRKRISAGEEVRHAGLYPPGFSAEHFGPNDYYYWDDFWGAAGLHAAARLVRRYGSAKRGAALLREALDFERSIFRSIAGVPAEIRENGIPAAPYRRMDAGAIGCLVADYPLGITEPGNRQILRTAAFLMEYCFHEGGFFQDMIHSGINAYLTLAVAQTLLRAGDERYRPLVRTVADLASPTGQWPEAIHPHTGGGCMGDGHHGWAAAEWVMMVRNLFVREEADRLVVGSGIFPEWLTGTGPVAFGPTPTRFGKVHVSVAPAAEAPTITVTAQWRDGIPEVTASVPGFAETGITAFGRPVPLRGRGAEER